MTPQLGVEPTWLAVDDVIDAHARQLKVFGGAPGIRDPGALASAMGRPINKWRSEDARMPDLAAACAFDIVRNHPFADGNKCADLWRCWAF